MNRLINTTIYDSTTNILVNELSKISKYIIIAIIVAAILAIGVKLLEKFLVKLIQSIIEKFRNK